MLPRLVVAIDGPAGAGKSTVAKLVARKFGLAFLDTGAMYRCVALKAIREKIGCEDADSLGQACRSIKIEFLPGDPQKVLLNGEDVTAAIRLPEVGDMASAISVHPSVRRQLVERQKAIVEKGGVTLEGRDTTTVIAPQAPVRVFLTASLEERARRRHDELRQKGIDTEYETLVEQMRERDERDSSRLDSPLMIAEGVEVIDTDQLDIDSVVELISKLVEQKVC